jgi:hypothetical protein
MRIRALAAILFAAWTVPARAASTDGDLALLRVWPHGREICFEAPFVRDWKAVAKANANFDVANPPRWLLNENRYDAAAASFMPVGAPLPPEAAARRYLLVTADGMLEVRPNRVIVTMEVAFENPDAERRSPQFTGSYCFPAKGLEPFGVPAAVLSTSCEVGFRRIPVSLGTRGATSESVPFRDRAGAPPRPQPNRAAAPPPAVRERSDRKLELELADRRTIPLGATAGDGFRSAALLLRDTGAKLLVLEHGESELCGSLFTILPIGIPDLREYFAGYSCDC